MKTTKEILSKQLDTNKGKNLLFNDLEEIISINPDFLNEIKQIKNGNIDDISDQDIRALVNHVVEELLKKIYEIIPIRSNYRKGY